MRTLYLPAIIAILSLTLFACKDKKGVNEDLDPTKTQKYDFMSVKTGTWWKYNSRAGTKYTRYARERDSVKFGLTYNYYERQDADTSSLIPEFYGKNGQYYITLLDLDGSRTSYLNYAFWRDSAKNGDSWVNTGDVYHAQTGNVSITTTSTQTESGLSMTFAGHTYQDVVHVRSTIKATIINLPLGSIDVWFVKGIGMIREEADINILNAYTVQHVDSLTDYKIVP